MQRYVSIRAWMGAVFSLCVVGFLTASPASGAPANGYSPALRRYPYLTDATGQYVTLNWATDRSRSSGGVRYGKIGFEPCTAHYVAGTKTAIFVNDVAEYQWQAQLNLQTGTQYCYRVYLGASSTSETDLLGSDTSPSFRTQLSSRSTQSFSFAVLGDWGQVNSSGTNSFQTKLMSLIASSGVRFVVTTGDNGYPSGNQTNYGDLRQTGTNTSAIFGPAFWKVPGASLPLFMTQGNHGLSSTDVSHPALINWPADRAVSTSGGRYKRETYCCLDGTTSKAYPSVWYAFNAGPARFYILQAAWSEANIGRASEYKVDYDYHWAPGTAQYNWLKADFAAHPSGLKFVFLHYPIHSDSPTQPSDTFLQGSSGMEGLFKQNGVDIVFSGHAHIYQRNRVGANGVVNYVTGGGGATLSALGICSSVDAYAIAFTTTGKACGSAPVPTSAGKVYHFLKVTVNGSAVTVTPVNSLGQSFDVMHYDFATSAQVPAPSALADRIAKSVPAALPVTEAPETSTQTPTPTISAMVTASPTATATLTCTPATPSPTTTQTATATATFFRTQVPQIPPVVTNTNTATATPTCTPTPQPPVTLTPGTSTPQTATPVVTVSPGGALTFISEADASAVQTLPTTNFGVEPTLSLQGGPGVSQISFVRFIVKGTHDTIRSVKLRLFATDGTADGPGVYLADNHWIESGAGGLTWNNQPDLWSGEIDNKGAIERGTWVDYDVSSMVMGDGTYTFALIGDGTDNVTFSSREGSAPPQLVVTFNP